MSPPEPAEKPPDVEIPTDKTWEEMSTSLRWYYTNGRDKIERNQKWLHWFKKALICKKCGRNYPPAAIDFHHEQGNRERKVSTLASETASVELIWEEIQKCEPLCANCHRVHHADPPEHVLTD